MYVITDTCLLPNKVVVTSEDPQKFIPAIALCIYMVCVTLRV